MTDDARKAMDAWLFDTHRCTHDPMGLQKTPVIEYAPTDVWLCAYCLADLFARLEKETQERRRLKAEVYALRAAAGEIVGVEPAGCPTPGACVAMRLQDRAAAIDEDNSWLRDENARLFRALKAYGRHKVQCATRARLVTADSDAEIDRRCDCGLDAALAGTGGSDA